MDIKAADTRRVDNVVPPLRLPRHTTKHARRTPRDPGIRQRSEEQANDIDEGRSRSVGGREITLQYADIEGQLVAVQMWDL